MRGIESFIYGDRIWVRFHCDKGYMRREGTFIKICDNGMQIEATVKDSPFCKKPHIEQKVYPDIDSLFRTWGAIS